MLGVLQDVGNADSGARTKCQMSVDYFIIPYTSVLIRLSHLYQGFHVHCIAITHDGDGIGDGRRWLIYIKVWVGEQGVANIS